MCHGDGGACERALTDTGGGDDVAAATKPNQVRDYLGSAAFSSAYSCWDYEEQRDVCLKVRVCVCVYLGVVVVTHMTNGARV